MRRKKKSIQIKEIENDKFNKLVQLFIKAVFIESLIKLYTQISIYAGSLEITKILITHTLGNAKSI